MSQKIEQDDFERNTDLDQDNSPSQRDYEPPTPIQELDDEYNLRTSDCYTQK